MKTRCSFSAVAQDLPKGEGLSRRLLGVCRQHGVRHQRAGGIGGALRAFAGLALAGLSLALLSFTATAQPTATLQALADEIRAAGLDPDECYRVREFDFTREDARIYLTDGFVIFGKPVNGRRFTAVFVGEIDGGDAEILMFPPLRSERLSLAKFTESPNLDEHFRFATFVFTDDTYGELVRRMQESFLGRKTPEAGPLYVEKYGGVVKNLSESLELRLVKDLMEPPRPEEGFFFASFRGSRLGAFDFVMDPLTPKGIRLGQFSMRGNQPIFDTWTEFESRSIRGGQRQQPAEDYAIDHYTIEATLGPDLRMSARTRMRLTPRGKRKTIAMLLSQDMQVQAARLGGEALEVYRPSAMRLNSLRRGRDSVFLIRLPESAVADQALEIEVEHDGKVVESSGNEVFFVGSRSTWYPGAGTRIATYDLTFRLPRGLDFVATSDKAEVTVEGDTAIHRIAVTRPVRSFGFNLGKYKTITLNRNGFTVNVMANKQVETALDTGNRVIVVPSPSVPAGRRTGQAATTVTTIPAPRPDPTQRLREIAGNVVTLLERYSALLGEPPMKTIQVSPIPGSFGQGFAGMIYLSTIAYLPEDFRPAFARDAYSKTFYTDLLLAHELSHQWWGNLVFTESDQDEWLMEGLATYSAVMMLEEQKGKRAAVEVMRHYRDNLLAELGDGRILDQAGPLIWGERLINSRDRNAWATITYEKGAWVFHMLRARMGDAQFRKMLAELPKRFGGRALTTSAFREFAAGFLPPRSDDRNLEEFFEQWVEGTGIPRLSFTSTVSGRAPKVRVEGLLGQSEVGEEFGALVPIVFRMARGQTEVRWARASNEGEELEWTFPTAPTKVELDPDFVTLRRD
jgi:hypothetical protein